MSKQAPMGPPAQTSGAFAMGRGGAAEQTSFAARGEARDVELATTICRVWGRHSPTRFRGAKMSVGRILGPW